MGCAGIRRCYCIPRFCMEPLRCIQRPDDSAEPHCTDRIERSSIQDAQRIRGQVLQEVECFLLLSYVSAPSPLQGTTLCCAAIIIIRWRVEWGGHLDRTAAKTELSARRRRRDCVCRGAALFLA